MGYYTSYALKWEGGQDKPTEEYLALVAEVGEDRASNLLTKGMVKIQKSKTVADRVAEWIKGNEEASGTLELDGSAGESSKWYDHEKDLIQLSQLEPDVLFTLEGEGENNEDIWKKYFLAGDVQEAKATVTIEPCRFTLPKGADE